MSTAHRPAHPPRGTSTSSESTRSETIILTTGLVGALVGTVAGLLTLDGTSPLSGRGSIGEAAALSSLAVSAVVGAATLVLRTPRAQPWMRAAPWWRRIIAIIGPTAVFAVLAFLLTSAIFAICQRAFIGVALDPVAGTLWVAVATGISSYVTAATMARLDGRTLATVLMVFLTVGVLTSAMISPDPYWWERYFSQLGEAADRSGFTFNLTLLLTGLALVTVGEFLAHDLSRWARRAGEPHWKVRTVQGALVALGVLLALVALVSRNVSVFWHNRFAESLVIVFGLALILFPILLRRLPGGLLVFTVIAFTVLAALVVLFEGVGYLNMTAFELGAAVTVYVWLLLFIRAVSAAGEGPPLPEETAGARAGRPRDASAA